MRSFDLHLHMDRNGRWRASTTLDGARKSKPVPLTAEQMEVIGDVATLALFAGERPAIDEKGE